VSHSATTNQQRSMHTQLVNFDAAPGDATRPSATPIYQTATFEQESCDEFGAFDYSRSGNPTRTVLEKQIATLEGGARALIYSSGMAAISSVLGLLNPGDELVADADLYGGTHRVISRILRPRGIYVRFVDATNPSTLHDAITANTKLVYVETPSNPQLRIVDLARAAESTHRFGRAGPRLVVDGTMMSPFLQQPLALGADIVIQSATKHLCGHGDVTAGTVAVRDADLGAQLAFTQNAEGTALGPFESFLLLRSIKTLGVRIERAQATAQRIAVALASRKEIAAVHFPGLPEHRGAAIHAAQARGPGSVLSVQTSDLETARRLCNATRLFATTVSFGSVHSSISRPAGMSHASVPADQRAVPESLVRISVGLEDPAELIADLLAALHG